MRSVATRPLTLVLAALATLAAGAFSPPPRTFSQQFSNRAAAASHGQPAQHAAATAALPRHAATVPQHASRASMVRMQEEDFYAELGVGRSASEGEIKKAYRAAARKWHPDVNQEPGAKEKFQSINEAYQILSDPQMRQRYDQFGVAGVRSGGAGGPGAGMQDFDLGDIFESFFGGQAGGPGARRRSGPMQGDDLRFDLEI